MSAQLPLNVRLRDSSSFDNYWSGRNREAVASLRAALDALVGGRHRPEALIYLWGEPGTGRTHLLEAACHMAHAHGRSAAYVPLAEARALAPTLLEDREMTALVCLDDLDAIVGEAGWRNVCVPVAAPWWSVPGADPRSSVSPCPTSPAGSPGAWCTSCTG